MSKAKIYYHDIGDYLSREEKLATLKKYSSVDNVPWETLTPNEHGDWLNQRNNNFEKFIELVPEKKFDLNTKSIFTLNSMGLGSSRDAWVYNSSKNSLIENIKNTIEFYNQQVANFKIAKKNNPNINVEDFIDRNSTKISWSSSLIPNVERGKETVFESNAIKKAVYRPFYKQYLYLGDKLIHRRGQFDEIFHSKEKNTIISISYSNNGLGLLISDCIADIHFNGDTQCFPLYYYEERPNQQRSLFDNDDGEDFIRRDGVSDFIFTQARKAYGLSTGSRTLGKEDIFYYVYGFLHCPEYRLRFANDLKKMLPRIPLVDDAKDFWAFSKAGRKLAELHINYESVAAYPDVKVVQSGQSGFDSKSSPDYAVTKMRFPRKDQKDTIFYNSNITISNIPAETYEYIVNGKSAIEWIMERYQITTHKESGICNDPNDWATEVGNPRYILDLLLSVINVSVQTVAIVKGLPEVRFD